jgi:hypothetical protein
VIKRVKKVFDENNDESVLKNNPNAADNDGHLDLLIKSIFLTS